jgi:hypothetical protein
MFLNSVRARRILDAASWKVMPFAITLTEEMNKNVIISEKRQLKINILKMEI